MSIKTVLCAEANGRLFDIFICLQWTNRRYAKYRLFPLFDGKPPNQALFLT